MLRCLATLTVYFGLLLCSTSAQSPSPVAGFPPGAFQSRAAVDASGGGGGSWHPVYDASGILAGTDDGGGDGGFLLRTVVNSALLTSGSSVQVRVTLLFGASSATVGSALTACYFGQAAAAGNASDFKGNQVQLLFSGAGTVNASAGLSTTSDSNTLGETWDSTKNYVLSCGVSASNTVTFSIATQTGASLWFIGSLAASAGTSVIGGMSQAANNAFLMSKIEIFF